MASIDTHPTVLTVRGKARGAGAAATPDAAAVPAAWLRQACLDAGADDVGFVSLDDPALDGDREGIRAAFPRARAVACIVCRMNVEPIRTPARSMANGEFHHVGDRVNGVAHDVVRTLAERGIAALNPPMAFPMEMDRFPSKAWTVSLKPLAVAAGLGRMGVHRNVIHPRFGNFILIGCVLIAADVTELSRPIDYNPCLDCKLCVAACPVGAIGGDGHFDFSACYTHNYREFMGGFTDWVEQVAESGSAAGYRRRVTDGESASMWQSLTYGANYKAAYCMSVCPAGEDVIPAFLEDRPGFVREVVRPLQQKAETVYVRPGSDAEAHVAKRFPHKRAKHVGRSLRPTTVAGFIAAMEHVFQRGQAGDLKATYHFRFTGRQAAECTVTIDGGTIDVKPGLVGKCDLRVTANGDAWVRFLRGEANIVWLLMTARVRLRGSPRLLSAFGRCFV